MDADEDMEDMENDDDLEEIMVDLEELDQDMEGSDALEAIFVGHEDLDEDTEEESEVDMEDPKEDVEDSEEDIEVPEIDMEDYEYVEGTKSTEEPTVQHVNYADDQQSLKPQPQPEARAKREPLRNIQFHHPIFGPRRSDFSIQITDYLKLLNTAVIKSRIYPQYWDVQEHLLPSELANAGTPLANLLPDPAIYCTGLYPTRAADIAGLYLATNTSSEEIMSARALCDPFLSKVLSSLTAPDYKTRVTPIKWGGSSLRGMAFRKLFHHICDHGPCKTITQAHIVRLQVSIFFAQMYYAQLQGNMQAAEESLESKWQRRHRLHIIDGCIARIMKSQGLSSPLAQSISVDEEWPEDGGPDGGRAPRRMLHGSGASQP